MTFRDEIRIIRPAAWIVAAAVYVAAVFGLWWVVNTQDPAMQVWPLGLKLLFCLLPPLITATFVLLVGYVYADAKRRGMRYVMWTLLAVFIPQAFGIILYFILRDPLLQACPACATLAQHGFAFCPKCGTSLARACPQCRHAVEEAWTHCAFCGASLSAAR